MTMPAVIFSHGQESGPWGTKIRSMAETVGELGCRVESIDYQGIADAGDRVRKLHEEVRASSESLVLVGSSMGGYVATAAAEKLDAVGLFVLAPAYYMPGFEAISPPRTDLPVVIVHGWRDDVVPVQNSIRFAEECHATLHIVDGDHRLTTNIEDINFLLARFVQQVAGNMSGSAAKGDRR